MKSGTTRSALPRPQRRVHMNPALSAAANADLVVPLFVLDEAILGSRFAAPNRLALLRDSLADLDESLRSRGARLFIRRGDPVREAMRAARACGAERVHVSADWSRYARERERRLREACRGERIGFEAHPGQTVLEPGAVTPASGDHFKVFTPYHRAWCRAPRRPRHGAPRRLQAPGGLSAGRLPSLAALTRRQPSPELPKGGETAGRRRMRAFLRGPAQTYGEHGDDLAADATSRLSPYLRFGCVSALELLQESGEGNSFARQLCWRDFFHQVLAAFPSYPRRDYRHRSDRWSRSRLAADAWREGRTGYPIVDAGMRQLAREGHMHNRARLIVASFLTKDLYLDWRVGARHFWDLLADGDVPNNAGNWQWVAGTGNDTRPNRVLNPIRQARRFDPAGDFVRRYVPELEGIPGGAVHEPWKLGRAGRRGLGYPAPIADHSEAVAEFRARRRGG